MRSSEIIFYLSVHASIGSHESTISVISDVTLTNPTNHSPEPDQVTLIIEYTPGYISFLSEVK